MNTSFQTILDFKALSLCISNAKGFLNFDLAHPQQCRLLKKDTKWGRYGHQKYMESMFDHQPNSNFKINTFVFFIAFICYFFTFGAQIVKINLNVPQP
jgi:hypothetical protein